MPAEWVVFGCSAPAFLWYALGVMPAAVQERILLIADGDRHVESALEHALPSAHVTSVASVFDGVAELAEGSFTTILASAEPIERRPEAAVRTLRELAGESRLLLFGHPTLEPLTRKMLDFGVDDYIVTPVVPAELEQLFGQPRLRISPESKSSPATTTEFPSAPVSGRLSPLHSLPLAEIVLDSMLSHPQDARMAAISRINSQISPSMKLHFHLASATAPPPPEHSISLTHPVRNSSTSIGQLVLHMPESEDPTAHRHVLTEIASLLGKLGQASETHHNLLRLVISDELTGAYNGRYFKHALAKICQEALRREFFVTLLLFDIDNFKKYNDDFGHGIGDEILKQTARVMKECCREHDVVARISGDEFAVIFWEKEGPRQPREPREAATPTVPPRPPSAPERVFERFRQRMASPEFVALGETGQGTLTISGGLAKFPWEANTPEELIKLADKRLMFGAKKSGKNALFLVGGEKAGEPPK